MSSVLSSGAANPTSGCSTASYSQLPTQDVACAVAVASNEGLPNNYKDFMRACCKVAPVESFASECGLYCLSIGQSVADLNKCFQDAGVNPRYIFCNGNNTATATATEAPTDSTSNPTAPGSSANPQGVKSAAPKVILRQGVWKAGLGILAILLLSAATEALL